jgi:hypothetical protein
VGGNDNYASVERPANSEAFASDGALKRSLTA